MQITKFSHLISKSNIHPELVDFIAILSENNHSNLILYGPQGSGKYLQALHYLKQFSPTNLRYEKKIYIDYNKSQYCYRISDVHIEIDIELLGCQAKALWYNIFNFIKNMAYITSNFFIVCKNFHEINHDLLAIFDCYMQKNYYKGNNIHFIIITDNLSFLHNNILNKCTIVNIAKPTKTNIYKALKVKTKPYNSLLELEKNIIIKPYGSKLKQDYLNFLTKGVLDIAVMRTLLYNILIYNIDINSFVNYIFDELEMKELITDKNVLKIMIIINQFFKLYNNNYRSIFHLEALTVNLIKEINE